MQKNPKRIIKRCERCPKHKHMGQILIIFRRESSISSHDGSLTNSIVMQSPHQYHLYVPRVRDSQQTISRCGIDAAKTFSTGGSTAASQYTTASSNILCSSGYFWVCFGPSGYLLLPLGTQGHLSVLVARYCGGTLLNSWLLCPGYLFSGRKALVTGGMQINHTLCRPDFSWINNLWILWDASRALSVFFKIGFIIFALQTISDGKLS